MSLRNMQCVFIFFSSSFEKILMKAQMSDTPPHSPFQNGYCANLLLTGLEVIRPLGLARISGLETKRHSHSCCLQGRLSSSEAKVYSPINAASLWPLTLLWLPEGCAFYKMEAAAFCGEEQQAFRW